MYLQFILWRVERFFLSFTLWRCDSYKGGWSCRWSLPLGRRSLVPCTVNMSNSARAPTWWTAQCQALMAECVVVVKRNLFNAIFSLTASHSSSFIIIEGLECTHNHSARDLGLPTHKRLLLLLTHADTLDGRRHLESGTFLNRRHYCDVWYCSEHFLVATYLCHLNLNSLETDSKWNENCIAF